MTQVICPGCKYVRRESEEFPSWGCPSCGVAYRKTAFRRARRSDRGLPNAAAGTESGWREREMQVLKKQFFLATFLFSAIGLVGGRFFGSILFGFWFVGVGLFLLHGARVMARAEMYFGHPFQLRAKENNPAGYYIELFGTAAGGLILILFGLAALLD